MVMTLRNTSGSYSGSYTGEEITCREYTHTPLASDQHYLEVTFKASRTDAGSTQNYFTCVVYEGEGKNRVEVTERYYIKNTYGQIDISQVKITLQADSSVIKYSDLKKPVEEGGYGGSYAPQRYTLTADPEVLALMERLGHRIETVVQTGDELTNRFDEVDTQIKTVVIVDSQNNVVTQNYNIQRLKGEMTVTNQ